MNTALTATTSTTAGTESTTTSSAEVHASTAREPPMTSGGLRSLSETEPPPALGGPGSTKAMGVIHPAACNGSPRSATSSDGSQKWNEVVTPKRMNCKAAQTHMIG